MLNAGVFGGVTYQCLACIGITYSVLSDCVLVLLSQVIYYAESVVSTFWGMTGESTKTKFIVNDCDVRQMHPYFSTLGHFRKYVFRSNHSLDLQGGMRVQEAYV